MDGGSMTVGVSSGSLASRWRQTLEQGSGWTLLGRLAKIAAFVGVPVAAMLTTGGLHTFAYWFGAWFQLAVTVTVVAALTPVWLLLAFVLFPVRWLLRRFAPGITERLESVGLRLLWVGYGLYLFIDGYAPEATVVRLPWPGTLGTLAVMAGWGSATALLLIAARSLELRGPARAVSGRGRGSRVSRLPPPPRTAVVQADPIVAWRVWDWTGEALWGFREEWSAAEKVAVCETCRQPPEWAHSCGIYSLKDRPQRYEAPAFGVQVVGTVELSGEIVEHDLGYRSQRAVIKELWAPDEDLFLELTMRYPEAVVWMDEEREVGA